MFVRVSQRGWRGERVKDYRRSGYRKVVLGLLQVLTGIYEMVFAEDAPKPGDVLRG